MKRERDIGDFLNVFELVYDYEGFVWTLVCTRLLFTFKGDKSDDLPSNSYIIVCTSSKVDFFFFFLESILYVDNDASQHYIYIYGVKIHMCATNTYQKKEFEGT